MANFRVEIFKQHGFSEWSNRYFVSAADKNDAHGDAVDIANAEAIILSDTVQITRVRVSTVIEDGRNGTSYPLDIAGQVTFDVLLPPANCLEALLSFGDAQPGRKYYHYSVGAGNQDDGLILPNYFPNFADFRTALLAVEGLVSLHQDPLTDVRMQPYVGMHQFYRAWARRSTTP